MLIIVLAAFLALSGAGPACAHDEVAPIDGDCTHCHYGAPLTRQGPHGGFTATTTKCDDCHNAHGTDAPSTKLLPAETVKDACNTCHDGSAGQGVYGVFAARGVTAGGGHRVDFTNVVPGGDATTGLSATVAFRGENGYLTCSDCHSPHGSNLVTAFPGERNRRGTNNYLVSARLLKQRPTGATSAVTEYGSDWCAACHKGRLTATGAHTHPVDSLASTTTPFTYRSVAKISLTAGSDLLPQVATGTTTLGPMGGSQRGYLMLVPRTSDQQGHAPICQQCHEDAREPGELLGTGDTALAATFDDSFDGSDAASGNPRFQVFPHETQNDTMVVELEDDLCTNCHIPPVLP